jgi:hypothetical protein
MKRNAARSIVRLLPEGARRVWLASSDEKSQVKEIENGILDMLGGELGDEKMEEEGRVMMRGLLARILDLLVVRVLPELGDVVPDGRGEVVA